ncbi:hypothetical protein COT63_01285 [Candidatus Shapirobacteria bacterium CG09_land_8_20_14_0_10_38_17]|uniref:Mannose-1-phosphate guanylyltransferase n=1 Tax=Candidatus Shapirobacteria bacterium CG09_land_8_20_14_0_10_38_17 TaxID=1974884 RepID=A0A2H0WR75_9BACT|nr:MAG: hypothetical protein COT63_01285 [Candidatus Shapirobacteria bacterium CG09_land_8_20_14_0_10_38_17]
MPKKEETNNYYSLIVCGGGGSRLWPLSRQKKPKQFISLFTKETLLQKTITRAQKITPMSRIFLVAGREYVGDILKTNPQINPNNIIVEPDKKHTAIAMILGAARIAQINSRATIINLWSDQYIENEQNFSADLKKAAQSVNERKSLATLGIKPTFPHTGLGYIKTGQEIKKGVFKVNGFIEKPNIKIAQKFIESGQHYWNLGTYIWPAEVFFQELKKLNPPLYNAYQKIRKSLGKENEWEETKKVYGKIKPISIDEAVAQKTKNMLMIRATFDWCDIGDWQAIWEKSKKNKNKNVILNPLNKKGKIIILDSKNNLIRADNKLIAVCDISDLIIVDTADALLVCRRDKSQKVKDLVDKIKEINPEYV